VNARLASGTRVERAEQIAQRLEDLITANVPEKTDLITSVGGGGRFWRLLVDRHGDRQNSRRATNGPARTIGSPTTCAASSWASRARRFRRARRVAISNCSARWVAERPTAGSRWKYAATISIRRGRIGLDVVEVMKQTPRDRQSADRPAKKAGPSSPIRVDRPKPRCSALTVSGVASTIRTQHQRHAGGELYREKGR
jgi:hypothetical protein